MQPNTTKNYAGCLHIKWPKTLFSWIIFWKSIYGRPCINSRTEKVSFFLSKFKRKKQFLVSSKKIINKQTPKCRSIIIYHTCLGTSRLLWVFISAPVGVRDRVNVVRKRCIALLRWFTCVGLHSWSSNVPTTTSPPQLDKSTSRSCFTSHFNQLFDDCFACN